MAGLGDLLIKIGVDLTELSTGMQNASRQLKRFGDDMEKLGKSMTTYVTAPLAAIAGLSLKAAADLEALKMGLEAVMGSSEAAGKEFLKLKEVAKLPGLGLKEAVQGSVNLQAAGFSADMARRSLMAFGNALATVGKGRADLDGVNLALTQIINKPKVMAQELNQLRERLPQISGAMKAAFGTASSEEIQNKGISPQEFVAKIVQEFEKLPKVTSGLKNAFENAKDTLDITLAGIGESINKAFDVEGILNKVAVVVTGLVEKFKELSPEVQKAILSIAGIAAAIGPIALVVGGMSAAIAAISLPVLAVVSIIGAAVALIVSYWDELVEYFSGPGSFFLEDLRTTAIQVFQVLRTLFEGFAAAVRVIWDVFGNDIMSSIKSVWDNVMSVVRTTLDMLLNVFNIFKGIFTGNWRLVWDSIVNLFKISFNNIISVAQKGVLALFDALSPAIGLLEKLGIGESIVNGFNAARSATDKFMESLKMVTTTAKETMGISFGLRSKGDADFVMASRGEGEPENQEYKRGGASESDIKKKHAAKVKAVEDLYKIEHGLLEQALLKNEITQDEFDKKELAAKLKKIDALMAIERKGNAEYTSLASERLQVAKDAHQKEIDTYTKNLSSQAAYESAQFEERKKSARDWANAYSEAMGKAAQATIQVGQQITQAIQQAAVNFIGSFAEMTGAALVGAGNFEGLGVLIIKTLADLAGQIGKIVLAMGVTMMQVKYNLFNNPAGAIAAGAALLVLSGALKGVMKSAGGEKQGVPAFATGGAVFGPMLAMVGDNPNASRDPEIIAPLSKLNNMIGNNQGQGGQVEFIIRDNVLWGILNNYGRTVNRTK